MEATMLIIAVLLILAAAGAVYYFRFKRTKAAANQVPEDDFLKEMRAKFPGVDPNIFLRPEELYNHDDPFNIGTKQPG